MTTRHLPRLPLAGFLALVLAFVAAGGCGVGEPTTTTFAYEGIGPEGGTITAGGVALYIPPGALAQDTAIEILPQAVPLPIEPPVNDPCVYTYLGPIHCCGPVGLDLEVPGVLRVDYDPNLIPIGHTVNDLVLLLWDNAASVMRPVTAGVFHDTVQHFFQVDAYVELGHLAVGVRTCPARGLVFAGGGQVLSPGFAVDPSGTQTPPPGLYLAQADNSSLPVQIPTDGALPSVIVCAPDGSRVLYEDYVPQSESSILRTVVPTGGTPVTVVDVDRNLDGGDPLFGWRRADGQVFFEEYLGGALASPAAGNLFGEHFSRASSDGSFPPAPQYWLGSTGFLSDQRQSDDGSTFLLRIQDFELQTERIDLITSAGTQLSSGLVPIGGGFFTPRFVPGSTDVYLVDSDAVGVLRYTAEGVEVGPIYTQDDGVLLDFVLAPDGQHYACLVRIDDGQVVADELRFGTLASGDDVTNFLDQQIFPGEVVFHPNGQLLYVDSEGQVRVFRAADGVELAPLPVNGMRNVDVSTNTGELLLLVQPILREVKAQPSGQLPPPPGIYVAPPDGSTLAPVNTNGLTPFVARWLRGWRAAPGVFSRGIR